MTYVFPVPDIADIPNLQTSLDAKQATLVSGTNIKTINGDTALGANSTFLGTDIDDAGITVGAVTTWLGRALSFGGTVTTDTDTITAPDCTPPTTPTTGFPLGYLLLIMGIPIMFLRSLFVVRK